MRNPFDKHTYATFTEGLPGIHLTDSTVPALFKKGTNFKVWTHNIDTVLICKFLSFIDNKSEAMHSYMTHNFRPPFTIELLCDRSDNLKDKVHLWKNIDKYMYIEKGIVSLFKVPHVRNPYIFPTDYYPEHDPNEGLECNLNN